MSKKMQEWLRSFVYSPEFLEHYPYYACILAKMEPIASMSVDVMGVSFQRSRFFLHVNVDFFVEHPQFLRGVLLHEVHHVVIGHLTNAKFRGAAHPDLMELAMEINANEYIREDLPGSPLTWKDHEDFGLRSGQSTLLRYELLAQARREGRHPFAPPLPSTDTHLHPGVLSINQPFETPDPEGDFHMRQLIREATDEADKACEALGRSSRLLAGKMPGQWLEELIAVEEGQDRYMDWKTAIRMFIALARAPVHTYSRPNRRFPEMIGVIPGRMYRLNRTDTPRLIIAIDTSGSMTVEELSEIAYQLIALDRVAHLTIVECDVVIQRVYNFSGSIQNVLGRGGTDLRSAFKTDFLREHRPDGIIYFTDGYGPYPKEDPGIRTLWILSKPHEFGCPWGQKAFMPRIDDIASSRSKNVSASR